MGHSRRWATAISRSRGIRLRSISRRKWLDTGPWSWRRPQNQFIGFTAAVCITVKCRWQPVDQPVVPTYADDLAAAARAGRRRDAVAADVVGDQWRGRGRVKPWSMMTRLPQAVWSSTPRSRARRRRRGSACRSGAEVDAVVQAAVAVDRVHPPAERRGDVAGHRVVRKPLEWSAAVDRSWPRRRARPAIGAAIRRLLALASAQPRALRRACSAARGGAAPARPARGRRHQGDGRPAASAWPACARAPARCTRFSAAALRCCGDLDLGVLDLLSCTVEQRLGGLEPVEHDGLLVDHVADGVELAGEVGGVLGVEHHREPISDGSPSGSSARHDLGRAVRCWRRPSRGRPRGRRGPGSSARLGRDELGLHLLVEDLGGRELALGLGEVRLRASSWAWASASALRSPASRLLDSSRSVLARLRSRCSTLCFLSLRSSAWAMRHGRRSRRPAANAEQRPQGRAARGSAGKVRTTGSALFSWGK